MKNIEINVTHFTAQITSVLDFTNKMQYYINTLKKYNNEDDVEVLFCYSLYKVLKFLKNENKVQFNLLNKDTFDAIFDYIKNNNDFKTLFKNQVEFYKVLITFITISLICKELNEYLADETNLLKLNIKKANKLIVEKCFNEEDENKMIFVYFVLNKNNKSIQAQTLNKQNTKLFNAFASNSIFETSNEIYIVSDEIHFKLKNLKAKEAQQLKQTANDEEAAKVRIDFDINKSDFSFLRR